MAFMASGTILASAASATRTLETRFMCRSNRGSRGGGTGAAIEDNLLDVVRPGPAAAHFAFQGTRSRRGFTVVARLRGALIGAIDLCPPHGPSFGAGGRRYRPRETRFASPLLAMLE